MRDNQPTPRGRGWAVAEAGLVAVGMAAFALLRSAHVAGGLASLGGLAVVAVALYLPLRSGRSPTTLFGLVPLSRRTWCVVAVGGAIGLALGMGFRWVWMPASFPRTLTLFVWTAVAIGAAEEVLYRGYVQGRLTAALAPRRTNPITRAHLARLAAAVILTAGAHAAYKALLFAWPPEDVAIDYTFLVTWTLIGGAAFGLLRAWAGNVWPALVAHVAFDVLAYGDAVHAPWWVWG